VVTVPRAPRAAALRMSRPLVLALVGLSLAAVLVSVLSLELVHPYLSWNRDEAVYLWHVDVLASGRLTAPLGEPVAAFRPWLGGIADGYFSQYTLGWPVVLLASDLALGTPAGAVAFGAVLAVVGAVLVTREVTGRDDVAIAVGIAFLATPAVVLQAGVHLGYLFTVGLGNLALALGWSGLRKAVPVRLVGAGLLLGWVLLTRPFDAVLWGAVLLVGGAVVHGWDVVRRGWPVALLGLPFVALTLAYNVRITGEATTFPIVAADPLDTFGLGPRRLMPGFEITDYDLGRAASGTAKNAAFFGLFLAGSAVTLVLAALGAWWRRAQRATWRLVLLGAAFPVGYFFFWGTHISSLTARLAGSIYYIPAIVPVLALAALGALELWWRARRTCVVAAVLALVVTLPVLADRVDVARANSTAQRPWSESVADLPDDSLVIVAESGPYLSFKNPVSRNRPELDDAVLYAVDLGPKNFETIEAHPGRSPYLQVSNLGVEELGPKEDRPTPAVEVVPLELVSGTALFVEAAYRPADGAPVVLPFVEVQGEVTWGRLSDVRVGGDGGSSTTFHLGADGVPLPSGPATVRVGFGAGQSVEEARSEPRVRWEVSVRSDRSGLTALLPLQQFFRYPVGDQRRWFPRPGHPGAAAVASVGR
jgi:hypothetical protein